MKVRKAIIPAAGLGTRLLPNTKSIPKEMLPLVDKPVIQYIVEEAVAAGVEEILIITNRGKNPIEDYFDYAPDLEERLIQDGKSDEAATVRAVADMADVFFLRQKETKGLGHAVWRAKSFVGNEPFAVMYGDDVIISEDPVVGQLCRAYEKYGCGVVGVKEVPREDVPKYCTLDVTPLDDKTMKVHNIIEKPTPEQILSCYSILGRVVMPPEIFDLIEKTPADPKSGEIYFTDAMLDLARRGELNAVDFDGIRYDMGNKLGIMQANCEVALNHPEIGADFKEYLKKLAATL